MVTSTTAINGINVRRDIVSLCCRSWRDVMAASGAMRGAQKMQGEAEQTCTRPSQCFVPPRERHMLQFAAVSNGGCALYM